MDIVGQFRFAAVLLLVATLGGCLRRDAKLGYLGDAELEHYKDVATSVDYPVVDSVPPEPVLATKPPRTIADLNRDAIRDLTITEALHLALQNNPVIRTDAAFLSTGNPLLNAGEQVSSVYDPAIQESGVLFGNRGVEAALSAFDPRMSAAILWGRDEQIQNNLFFGGGLNPGNTLQTDTADFQSRLTKQFAYGGQFSVFHNWNYRGANVPFQLFNSVYTGTTGAEYRHPLLAGSGTRFTRIAGPIADAFGGLTGVSQGVVIARINNDITIADFEQSVQQLLRETENLYWDLYLAYRLYDTAVTARNSALRSWREAELKRRAGGIRGFDPVDEAQARDQYYQALALTQQALSSIYETEIRLRRMLGLPVNDETVLRPSSEPATARFIPVWELCLAEALTRRVELRRQKFLIKSLELQLEAARTLVRPRLDFLSNYRVNAFGDTLLEQDDDDGVTGQGLNSAYETLTQGNQTGWNLGLEFTMNLGFRSAVAQVRNIELRLAKARDVLATMEMDVAHELAIGFQDLTEAYTTAQANLGRRAAAHEFLRLAMARYTTGASGDRPDLAGTLDLVLRAQASVAQAERDLYTSIVNYNRAIVDIYYRKGTLLDYNNVALAENEWTHEAYQDALRRALARSHAHPNRLLHSEPLEFVLPNYDGQHIAPPTLEDLTLPPANGEVAPPPPPPLDSDDLHPNGALGPPVPAGLPLAHRSQADAIVPTRGEASLPSLTSPRVNLFFDDSEQLAPFDEELELKARRDLLE
ncbi:MAG TPA: TolC family protein [Planctomycetaceae bacterium]|nr:TolC family protein [Planctomycetaceae bacterium]